jgi:hypothetical protein
LDNERKNYYDNLSKHGGDLVLSLENLAVLSNRNMDMSIEMALGKGSESLLKARLHAMKFFTFHSEEEYQMYLSDFNLLVNNMNSLSLDFVVSDVYKTDYAMFKESSASYLNGMAVLHNLILKLDDEAENMSSIESYIRSIIESILTSVSEEELTLETQIQNQSNILTTSASVIAIIAIILTVIVSALILRLVIRPIQSLKETFEGVSEGKVDFDFRLNERNNDEIGKMSHAFNKFMIKLKALIEDVEYQNWSKTAQNDIHEAVRDEEDINIISHKALNYICEYLDLQIGAIYTKADENNELSMIATYAYSNRKGFTSKINAGEGILGQCVVEKKSFIINDLPDEYIAIQSGLGSAQPKNIAVIPCLFEGQIEAIIEVGSLKEIDEQSYNLLKSIAEDIAQTLHSAILRNDMRILLEKTVHQSEELQMQQEELRQSNEELEEQSRALKESESRLQAQQEELRVSNEELEQRTKQLEIQKKAVDDKNSELLIKQTEILEKADALELANTYKSEFLANMSHELRTPLNSILVLSKLLTDRDNALPLSAKEVQFADTINSSGADLLKLINDILDLSKVESGHLDLHYDDIIFKELLYDSERMFSSMAEIKGINLITSVDEKLPPSFKSDVGRIQQILKNLVSNAIKFTHEGSVYLSARKPTTFECDSSDCNTDSFVAIEVSDTGIGIERDKQRIIFEAFRQADGTTSRKFGGTGLGLTISRELSSLLGGQILLESTYGEGSKFVLLLPLDHAVLNDNDFASQDNIKLKRESIETFEPAKRNTTTKVKDEVQNEEPIDDLAANLGVVKSNENKLLIIEDDITFARILANLAEEKGFVCDIASDGKSGKELAIKLNPSAIIMDIGLPDIDGLKLSKELGRLNSTKHIPIHIISGMEKDLKNNLPSSVIGFLKKPVEIKTIYKTLAKIEAVTKSDQPTLLVIGSCGDENFQNFSKLGKVSVKKVDTPNEAMEKLSYESIDCIVLDFALEDGDLLKNIFESHGNIPTIIYSENELNDDELNTINKYSNNIILKGAKSEDRLKDEVTLFLHGMAEGIKSFPSSNSNRNNVYLDELKHQVDSDDTFKDKKVLIVDDDERNVFALSNLLQQHGIEIVVANNGEECINMFKANKLFDMILMDIMMPKIDGYEAIETLRKMPNGKDIPIIVLSAKAMKENKDRCLAVGASDYMTKPIDVEKLLSLLRVWIK